MGRGAVTIKLIGLVSGGPTEFDGKYLVDYDPTPLDSGDVLISVSEDPAGARKFTTAAEAMEVWRGVSLKGPRPDGEPDRPLTAFSVEIA